MSQRTDQGFVQAVDDCLATLPLLHRGLDVNVHFVAPDEFESTKELAVFDLFRVNLYHAWVVDTPFYAQCVSVYVCYNRLTEGAIKGNAMCSSFLTDFAAQCTEQGLQRLTEMVQDNLPFVFFRNNHFSVVVKANGQLWSLITDVGFEHEEMAWESLCVNGDSQFVASLHDTEYASFYIALHWPSSSTNWKITLIQSICLSSSYELAKQIHEQETQIHEQETQRIQQESPRPSQASSNSHKKDSCLIM
jgi:hypothetical protein